MGAFARGTGVRASSGNVGNTLGRRLGAGAGATAAKLGGWPRTRPAASKCTTVSWVRKIIDLSSHPPSTFARAST